MRVVLIAELCYDVALVKVRALFLGIVHMNVNHELEIIQIFFFVQHNKQLGTANCLTQNSFVYSEREWRRFTSASYELFVSFSEKRCEQF